VGGGGGGGVVGGGLALRPWVMGGWMIIPPGLHNQSAHHPPFFVRLLFRVGFDSVSSPASPPPHSRRGYVVYGMGESIQREKTSELHPRARAHSGLFGHRRRSFHRGHEDTRGPTRGFRFRQKRRTPISKSRPRVTQSQAHHAPKTDCTERTRRPRRFKREYQRRSLKEEEEDVVGEAAIPQ